MESTIHMTYRFRNLFAQKDDQARDLERKIQEHLNIAQQKYAHAKVDYEASLKRGGGMDGNELRQREQALEMYKKLYEKAKNYAESAKKLYQNIHGEVERAEFMTNRQRNKLEKSKEEGDNFLKKAIAALNDYMQ
ncbi:MAG: hypothetical protein IKZ48_01980 [Prevotella sp.]|nr:hypothetical protein [Prevotella sp.]